MSDITNTRKKSYTIPNEYTKKSKDPKRNYYNDFDKHVHKRYVEKETGICINIIDVIIVSGVYMLLAKRTKNTQMYPPFTITLHDIGIYFIELK